MTGGSGKRGAKGAGTGASLYGSGPFRAEDFRPGLVPPKPGVYVFRDRFQKIIYVGKAVNLRKRMAHYFRSSTRRTHDPKLRSLVNSIAFWECHHVRVESESLILESKMIKEYAPRYNVVMRDDKRYMFVKLDMGERLPRLRLVRLRKNDKCRYFGPFPQAAALRQTVDYLTRRFKLRACSADNPGERDRLHCPARFVKDCLEPCVGKISTEDYAENVARLVAALEGDVEGILNELRERMAVEAEGKRFERAAMFRDMAENVETTLGKGKGRGIPRIRGVLSERPEEAVRALRDALGIVSKKKDAEFAVEAFDVSNISGTLAVSGMVAFAGGKPDKRRYRRFKIRNEAAMEAGGDDFAMIAEAVSRRYGGEDASPPPDLLLIDGGKGQLNAAIRALKGLGIPPLPVISLAKRNEEVFIPGRDEPLTLDLHSPALNLLRAIRDESHRFSVDYHRKLRDAGIERSILDRIPGVGPARKKALLKAFGSLDSICEATAAEIAAAVPGIGAETADRIAVALAEF